MPDGRAAAKFDEMVRETIGRRLRQLEGEELLDLLGHLIARERRQRDEAMQRHPSASSAPDGTGQTLMRSDDQGLSGMLA